MGKFQDWVKELEEVATEEQAEEILTAYKQTIESLEYLAVTIHAWSEKEEFTLVPIPLRKIFDLKEYLEKLAEDVAKVVMP